jgi:hypothetical protein
VLPSVLPCDKLHIHFCKYILGANKTSTNFAILSELGRIPFALDCFTSVFKYWYRLDSSTNFLLKSAYIENKFLRSQGCDTWYSDLQRLFKIFDNNTGIHNMLKYKHNTFNRKIKVFTKAFYKNKWYVKRNKLLDENGKLRTYLKLKCNFGFKNYLQILSESATIRTPSDGNSSPGPLVQVNSKWTNQKQALPVVAMFVDGSG